MISDAMVVAIMFFAALAWGANEPWAMCGIVIGSLAALAGKILWDGMRGQIQLPREHSLVAFSLFLLYVSLQMMNPRTGQTPPGNLLPGTLEPRSTTLYFLLALACFALALLVGSGFSSRRRIRWLVLSICILGGFEALYGLVQYLGDHNFIWDYAVNSDIARGTLINRNHYALLLNLTLCGGLGYLYYRSVRLLHGRDLSIRHVVSSPGSAQLLWVILWLGLIGLALILSMSRMGIVAMFACVSVMLVRGKATERGKRTTVLGFALLFAILSLALYTGIDAVLARFEKVSDAHYLEKDRIPIWRATWKMIRQSPLSGNGLGTFQWSFPAFENYEPDIPARYAHNDYLQALAEVGPIGLLLLGAAFISCWRTALKNLKYSEDPMVRGIGLTTIGALVATGVQELTDFSLYIPGVAVCFSVILGLNMRAARLRLAGDAGPNPVKTE